MNPRYDKLKKLLKELFQLDQPDLDFGLYRIMHAKSGEVTAFLDEDLLPQVKQAFALYQPADKAALEHELAQAIEQARSLGVDPEATQKVKDLREKLANTAVDIASLEAEVYDHLYSFFRRYYSEGDFLSKRVYKEGVYAIPYEGEEVTLHWANKDQYYIKTSEYLRDYCIRLRPDDAANPMRVHFRLADAAEGEHGNVKAAEGKDRVFVLAATGESGHDFLSLEDGPQGPELAIRFEYRPATLTDWPAEAREGKTKPPTQKDLTAFAVARVLAVAADPFGPWITELRKPHATVSGDAADYSRIEGHLKRYTARNTFDYFIHKDLGTFLRRELDFYIKNEVMHLDDIENEKAPRVEQYLSKIRVIRRIAGKIIEFLAQLEDFQKKLWLKKKFVVETQWCVRVGCIPEKFYAEIAANAAQRAEWVSLFAIDEIEGDLTTVGYSVPLKPAFLKVHPTIVVDTRHFDAAFTARLLESLGDVDELTDGVLFHSENFQALSLMKTTHAGTIDCVYIDPPYNTASSEITYKNEYKDSSWLSLMQDRVALSQSLIRADACYAIAIDDYEVAHLIELMDERFRQYDIHIVVVNHHPQGGMSNNVSRTHEYMLVATPLGQDILRGSKKTGENELRSFMLSGPGENKSRSGRPNSFYAILIDERTSRVVGCEPPPTGRSYPTTSTQEGYARRYPISPTGEEKVWCRAYSSATEAIGNGEIVVSDSGTLKLSVDIQGKRHSLMSNWTDARYNAGPHGTALLAHILNNREAFSYPKSLYTVRDALEAMTWPVLRPRILDFFGGSATTAHAVMLLNREDNGGRRFVLCEMGDYCDTVVIPRLKKTAFAPEWKDGKPKRLATPEEAERSPRIMKIVRLESYEDTLNNLDIRRSDTQKSLLDEPAAKGDGKLREQYLLKYMLDVETRGSQSLLNVAAFRDPTAYRLSVKRPGSDESREVCVDLLETFNWLIGLTVEAIAAPQVFSASFERDAENRLQLQGGRIKADPSGPFWFRRVEGKLPDGRKALVVWRKLGDDLEQANLVLDFFLTDKLKISTKDFEFDVIYVNGSNNLENLKAPDDTWKVRLLEEEFHRLMFATEAV
jgi:adenine-specific DNA-methyltransferase